MDVDKWAALEPNMPKTLPFSRLLQDADIQKQKNSEPFREREDSRYWKIHILKCSDFLKKKVTRSQE